MAEVDWRVWLKQRVDALAGTTNVQPAQVHAAGSEDFNVDARPFMIIKLGPELPGPFPGVVTRNAVIWVHDEPGSYMNIDAILKALKDGLHELQVALPGGVVCRWNGDSTELADDGYKTITRNTSYQLQGKG